MSALRRARLLVLALACVLATGCGSQGPASSAPGASGPPTSGQPAASEIASATGEPVDSGPLPEPVLGSAEEIAAAMSDPAQAAQVVVSMLKVLGIGLYQPDGSTIRAGTETSDADFYMFEPAARGLANMLRDRDSPDEQMSFRDLHAALAHDGYERSAEELATAYADAYAAHPNEPISLFVSTLGHVDADAKLSSFEVWLLLVDGFVRPNTTVSAVAFAGNANPVAAVRTPGWGVARGWVQGALSAQLAANAAIASQLRALVAAWRITVTPFPATVHEGHGAVGSPAQITAHLSGPAQPLTSPFGGATVIPAASGAAGLDIGWFGNTNVDNHGSLSTQTTTLGQGGETSITYTPQQEVANGQGIEREAVGRITALFLRQDLVLQLYGVWAAPYAAYLGGSKDNVAIFHIGWHEKAEAVVKIVWTDTYDGVDDTITFLGNLTGTEPDPVSGGVVYTGTGTATGSRAGWKACNPGIDVVPSGTVPATFNGYLTPTGSIVIAAYANIGTTLSGISTAGMEVPIVGGFAQFDLPSSGGELCPHSSHGEMTVSQLALP